MKYIAEVVKHDTDAGIGMTFDTWQEAGEWILSMRERGYDRPRVNGDRVSFFPGNVMYNAEPEEAA